MRRTSARAKRVALGLGFATIIVVTWGLRTAHKPRTDLISLLPSGADFVIRVPDSDALFEATARPDALLGRLIEKPEWDRAWPEALGLPPEFGPRLAAFVASLAPDRDVEPGLGQDPRPWIAGEVLIAGRWAAPGAPPAPRLFGPPPRPPFPLADLIVVLRPKSTLPGIALGQALGERVFRRFVGPHAPRDWGLRMVDGLIYLPDPVAVLGVEAFGDFAPPPALVVAAVDDVIVLGTRLESVRDLLGGRRTSSGDPADPPPADLTIDLSAATRARLGSFLPRLLGRDLAAWMSGAVAVPDDARLGVAVRLGDAPVVSLVTTSRASVTGPVATQVPPIPGALATFDTGLAPGAMLGAALDAGRDRLPEDEVEREEDLLDDDGQPLTSWAAWLDDGRRAQLLAALAATGPQRTRVTLFPRRDADTVDARGLLTPAALVVISVRDPAPLFGQLETIGPGRLGVERSGGWRPLLLPPLAGLPADTLRPALAGPPASLVRFTNDRASLPEVEPGPALVPEEKSDLVLSGVVDLRAVRAWIIATRPARTRMETVPRLAEVRVALAALDEDLERVTRRSFSPPSDEALTELRRARLDAWRLRYRAEAATATDARLEGFLSLTEGVLDQLRLSGRLEGERLELEIAVDPR